MLTCQSPRKVMRLAHRLAQGLLPAYASTYSRHDFTLPQLFACLVVREHQRKSYRQAEALLKDCRPWCRDIGMKKIPDHNTLCRAFHRIITPRHSERLLDLLACWFTVARQLGSTLAIDSSLYDTHHRSRHYEQRCRHHSSNDAADAAARRSRSAKRTPKLAVGIDTRSHVILAATTHTGMGSDCRDFEPLVRAAARRRRHLQRVLADAGYDSEANHRLARRELGLESLIKSGAGRPTAKPASTLWRRMMQRKLTDSQKGRPYGQRAQVETVNSMLKRNLGDSLRAKSPKARRLEQLLRVITHNLMIA